MNINFYDGSGCSPCNQIWSPVDELPDVEKATRNHAYILPDNTVWVLNHDGTGFMESDGTEADPLNIVNTDGNLIISRDGTNFTVNISDKLVTDKDTTLPELKNNQFLGNMGNGLEPITEATNDIIEAGVSEVATIVSPKELREAIVNLINSNREQAYDDTVIRELITNLQREVEGLDKNDNDTIYNDEEVRRLITELTERVDALPTDDGVDNDTIYNDAEVRQLIAGLQTRIQELEAKPDKDTKYDDTELRNLIQSFRDTNTTYTIEGTELVGTDGTRQLIPTYESKEYFEGYGIKFSESLEGTTIGTNLAFFTARMLHQQLTSDNLEDYTSNKLGYENSFKINYTYEDMNSLLPKQVTSQVFPNIGDNIPVSGVKVKIELKATLDYKSVSEKYQVEMSGEVNRDLSTGGELRNTNIMYKNNLLEFTMSLDTLYTMFDSSEDNSTKHQIIATLYPVKDREVDNDGYYSPVSVPLSIDNLVNKTPVVFTVGNDTYTLVVESPYISVYQEILMPRRAPSVGNDF